MSPWRGHQIAATFFGILGAATIALYLVAVLLSRPGSPALGAISVLYGLTALLTAYGLWRRSSLAPRAFVGWCSTIALFLAAFLYEQPAAADPLLILPMVLGIGILYFAWRRISRMCARAA